jgi:hypothetical protein
MVPGAPNRVVDEHAVRKRSMVVSAVRPDGKELVTGSRQQHILVPDAPGQHGALLHVSYGNALAKIRSRGNVRLSHVSLASRHRT